MSVKQEVIDYLVNTNDPEYNYKKCLEEIMELGEVLIKTITKKPEYRPPVDKVIEEAGDVMFRLRVLTTMLGIREEVKQRFEQKAEQLAEHMRNGKYKGGL